MVLKLKKLYLTFVLNFTIKLYYHNSLINHLMSQYYYFHFHFTTQKFKTEVYRCSENFRRYTVSKETGTINFSCYHSMSWLLLVFPPISSIAVQIIPLNWISLVLSFREGNGTPLQYSCQEHPMDRGAWQAAALGVGYFFQTA